MNHFAWYRDLDKGNTLKFDWLDKPPKVRGVIKKYVEKCYNILNIYSIETKFDTYKLY